MNEAVGLIQENVEKDVIQKTSSSGRSVEDLALCARVERVLVGGGKDVSVTAKEDHLTPYH